MMDTSILPSAGQSAPLRSFYQDEAFYAGLDPGIRFAVRVLHAHGLETCQSCEAGPGHCYPEPSVDLPATGDDALGFAPLLITEAWVLTRLWLWFFVPLGLPAIGIGAAGGLETTLGFVVWQFRPRSKTVEERREQLRASWGVPFIALFIGWCFHYFGTR